MAIGIIWMYLLWNLWKCWLWIKLYVIEPCISSSICFTWNYCKERKLWEEIGLFNQKKLLIVSHSRRDEKLFKTALKVFLLRLEWKFLWVLNRKIEFGRSSWEIDFLKTFRRLEKEMICLSRVRNYKLWKFDSLVRRNPKNPEKNFAKRNYLFLLYF